MKYLAKVKRIEDDLEEQVVLLVNGIELTCFASMCPYEIKLDATYQVELTAQVFHEYVINLNEEEVTSTIDQIADGFSHLITGRLIGNSLVVGEIVFEDDVLLSDFGYLDGRLITWKVDRIDAEFLSGD